MRDVGVRSAPLARGSRHWLLVAVLALITLLGSLPTRPAMAAAILNAAATTAVGGLGICSSKQGKDLYNCVADVLDRMASSIGAANVPETQRALQTAAAGLRAATSKSQAISAIARCQSVISGALKQVRAAGGRYVPGWGDTGLTSISSVLSRAIQLIQSKG
ncbi:hypothetical protein [Bradyrhizobium aeschynomenes]|uniref:hypothetical protein n=1 Tax=Bradyrhizobium aeschynomenes TaxID=2734909 RepID=UPI001FF0503B|nr:hypothetical protein [Bradyrhizobium aeschynomenes]